MENMESLNITYSFGFDGQETKSFHLLIDPTTMFIVEKNKLTPPDWAELKSFKCPNCPLDVKRHKYCPLAKHLSFIIDFFQAFPSYHEAIVTVETDERTSFKETTVQLGVGSLMGIIMSCSGCPVIGKLSSLARFHLPFASIEETEYRVLAIYIVAQYVKMKQGEKPDWQLKNLKHLYEEIQIVNKNIVEKLSDVEMNDTSRNAVVTLSNFAEYIIWNIEDKKFNHIENIVSSFKSI
ncbi:MAG: hypothetical protein KKB34_04350 [Bacteroidetes bacterium]|nr:hypothetical protein [Bacteroidota bacterium]